MLAAVLALALCGTALAKTKPVPYVGKTKEGAKISFKLDKGGWIRGLRTMAPMSCGSAQGGNPKGRLATYWPPFDFKLGYKIHYKETGGLTKYYNIRTKRKSKRSKTITGHLEANWSLLGSDGWGGYKILVCETTSSFTAHPKR